MTLEFTKLEVWEVRIPFRFSFKHSLAERKEAHNLILRIETNTGHYGFGEVLPRTYLTGETIESAWTDIAEKWWPAVRGRVCQNPRDFLRETYARADAERKTASYAGIDIAVFDAWARANRVPGWAMLGQKKPGESQRMTLPLGGGGPRSVKWLARLGRVLGFQEYKLKTGMKNDLARLSIVRRVIGEKADLRVDANAAFSSDAAILEAKTLRRFGVSSVEQPIAAGDAQELARVGREGGIAVMADESLCTTADAKVLLQEKAAGLWNLRLAKMGGFSGFLTMAEMAIAAGIKIHHGTLVGETQVLTAASRACLGAVSLTHLEYGYPGLLLKKKLFRNGPGGNFGVAHALGDRAGLGVELNEEVLSQFLVKRESFT
jgi:L-alanine-DL-glutamate epimerase-like enolase superfamily enzyme